MPVPLQMIGQMPGKQIHQSKLSLPGPMWPAEMRRNHSKNALIAAYEGRRLNSPDTGIENNVPRWLPREDITLGDVFDDDAFLVSKGSAANRSFLGRNDVEIFQERPAKTMMGDEL